MVYEPFNDAYTLAAIGDLPGLKQAIQKNPQLILVATPGHNRTILWIATRRNRGEIVDFLFKQEQSEDKIWHVTLLHYALSGGHLATAEMLIRHGALVRPYSSLLLDISARRRRLDLVRLLLLAGADGAAVPPYSVILSDSSEMLELLIGEGLEINNREENWPVLVYVCRGDKGEHPERVRRLLDLGADVNIRARHNLTALHTAARAGFNTIVEILLKYGADISAINDAGDTPRDLAIKAKRFETASLLQNYER